MQLRKKWYWLIRWLNYHLSWPLSIWKVVCMMVLNYEMCEYICRHDFSLIFSFWVLILISDIYSSSLFTFVQVCLDHHSSLEEMVLLYFLHIFTWHLLGLCLVIIKIFNLDIAQTDKGRFKWSWEHFLTSWSFSSVEILILFLQCVTGWLNNPPEYLLFCLNLFTWKICLPC